VASFPKRSTPANRTMGEETICAVDSAGPEVTFDRSALNRFDARRRRDSEADKEEVAASPRDDASTANAYAASADPEAAAGRSPAPLATAAEVWLQRGCPALSVEFGKATTSEDTHGPIYRTRRSLTNLHDGRRRCERSTPEVDGSRNEREGADRRGTKRRRH